MGQQWYSLADRSFARPARRGCWGDWYRGDEMATIAPPALDAERLARLLADRRTRLTGHPLSFASKLGPERTLYFAEAFRTHADQPLPIRWALAVAHALDHVAIAILPDEVIVGEPGVGAVDADRLAAARSYLADYRLGFLRDLPTFPYDAEYTGIGLARGWHSRTGHNILDYAVILDRGLGSFQRQIESALSRQAGLTGEAEQARRDFFLGAACALGGLERFIRRHATLARALARTAPPAEASRLNRIGDTCEWISAERPRSFLEALQLLWLVHLASKLDDGGVGHSFGRLDQYAYQFYRADLDSGRQTASELLDILTAFWIKLNAECEEASHLTLGGLTGSGADATNELSFACLVAEQRVSLTVPNLSVRVHSGTSPEFWLEAARTISRGAGHPAIFSDEVTVPGLLALGVPIEDARGYAKVGCVETFFEGRSVPWIDCYVNAPKCLELALTGGRCLLTDREVSAATPLPDASPAFESLLLAFLGQLRQVTQLVLRAKVEHDLVAPRFQSAPLESALTPCALNRGLDLYAGGADYHLTGSYLVGLATAVDSLAAIRRLVFEDHALTLSELVTMLRDDFAGHESLRLRCANQLPKYGNDDDEVDDLARRVVAEFARAVTEAPKPEGWLHLAMIGSVWGHTLMGERTGATADGRHRGEALSDGGSPAPGRSRKGATAALRSVAKPNHTAIPGGEAVNLTISPASLRGPGGLTNLVGLLRGYFALGGEQIQINVHSRETLEAARRDPDAHRHLVVRVAGFCAYFTCLDTETQREIIERTEHAI